MLEVFSLILFSCLIIYFVVTIIVIAKFKRYKKINKFLMFKYSMLSKKSFLVDRNLSLYSMNKLSINEVYDSFVSLYKEVTDIDSTLNNMEV